jgi:hypothetical protein
VGKVYQLPGGFNSQYCLDMMEGRTAGLGPPPQPEYAAKQSEVSGAVREAFAWLQREGYVIPTPGHINGGAIMDHEAPRKRRFVVVEK